MNRIGKHSFQTTCLAIALVLGTGPALVAQSPGPIFGGSIQGAWTVTVTQRNCATGQAIGQPFPSLLTFHQGGTLSESTANPGFYPDPRLPGEGYWTVAGPARYQASSIALITDNGALAETQRIDQSILLAGDALASDAKVRFFDPHGNLIRAGCATAVAQRYK